jgi:hypothetical protein
MNEECHSFKLQYEVLAQFILSRLAPYVDEVIGIISVDFDIID